MSFSVTMAVLNSFTFILVPLHVMLPITVKMIILSLIFRSFWISTRAFMCTRWWEWSDYSSWDSRCAAVPVVPVAVSSVVGCITVSITKEVLNLRRQSKDLCVVADLFYWLNLNVCRYRDTISEIKNIRQILLPFRQMRWNS